MSNQQRARRVAKLPDQTPLKEVNVVADDRSVLAFAMKVQSFEKVLIQHMEWHKTRDQNLGTLLARIDQLEVMLTRAYDEIGKLQAECAAGVPLIVPSRIVK